LNELVAEIIFNVKIPVIEKHLLVRRALDQKKLETFDDRDLRKLAKEIEKQ